MIQYMRTAGDDFFFFAFTFRVPSLFSFFHSVALSSVAIVMCLYHFGYNVEH